MKVCLTPFTRYNAFSPYVSLLHIHQSHSLNVGWTSSLSFERQKGILKWWPNAFLLERRGTLEKCKNHARLDVCVWNKMKP